MSAFFHWWVIVITVINLLGCWWLIRFSAKSGPTVAEGGEDTTGHTWDGLREFNNPLPRWWLWMFYITLVFAVIYLALYPGLGNFKGIYGWTQEQQYEAEVAKAEETYGPIFAKYASQDLAAVAADPEARQMGENLFLTYCSQCHGSDARGAPGFPNLADNDWLYGGDPQAIKMSILNGRNGVMPPFGAALGDQGVKEVAAYVVTLSGREADPQLAAAGKEKFGMCAACHGMDGTGNQALGAPNLTDNTWLYGGSMGVIEKSIREGRNGQMPAHDEFLGEEKVHLLAAYVYSLSQK
jgi:cytochrome c oxidase cbb3-type subunit 3